MGGVQLEARHEQRVWLVENVNCMIIIMLIRVKPRTLSFMQKR